jgi:hypothetical protein
VNKRLRRAGQTVCKPEPAEPREAFTGKVVSLIYDGFGDFRGFVLDTEDGTRRFAARELARRDPPTG